MDDDAVVLVALTDFEPAEKGELPLHLGELVTLEAPAVEGWVKVCPLVWRLCAYIYITHHYCPAHTPNSNSPGA